MKYLFSLFILLSTPLASAFDFVPTFNLGVGFYTQTLKPQEVSYGQILGLAYALHNEPDPGDQLKVNVLGAGIGLSSTGQTFLVLSPMNFIFRNHWGLGYSLNLHPDSSMTGFFLSYQF